MRVRVREASQNGVCQRSARVALLLAMDECESASERGAERARVSARERRRERERERESDSESECESECERAMPPRMVYISDPPEFPSCLRWMGGGECNNAKDGRREGVRAYACVCESEGESEGEGETERERDGKRE